MPGIFGGIVSMIAIALADERFEDSYWLAGSTNS